MNPNAKKLLKEPYFWWDDVYTEKEIVLCGLTRALKMLRRDDGIEYAFFDRFDEDLLAWRGDHPHHIAEDDWYGITCRWLFQGIRP